jgi:hypothetical protein
LDFTNRYDSEISSNSHINSDTTYYTEENIDYPMEVISVPIKKDTIVMSVII